MLCRVPGTDRGLGANQLSTLGLMELQGLGALETLYVDVGSIGRAWGDAAVGPVGRWGGVWYVCAGDAGVGACGVRGVDENVLQIRLWSGSCTRTI